MSLHPDPSYPSRRRYVLRLHRDADPAGGTFTGRVENICTGRSQSFGTVEEFVLALSADLDDATAASPGEST